MDKPGEVNRVAKHPMKHKPSKTSLAGSESMMIVAKPLIDHSIIQLNFFSLLVLSGIH
jgi:hypothetical protein